MIPAGNETAIDLIVGNMSQAWGQSNLTIINNGTEVGKITGVIHSYTLISGYDLIFAMLLVILVCSVLSTVFLGLMVWKMYLISGLNND